MDIVTIDMRKRFLWSLLFSAVFMFILAPVNHYLTTDIHTLEQASDRNFVSLLIVESILVFGVAFQVISQYFSKHPDYKSVVFTHRRNNPNIPGEYYKVADVIAEMSIMPIIKCTYRGSTHAIYKNKTIDLNLPDYPMPFQKTARHIAALTQ